MGSNKGYVRTSGFRDMQMVQKKGWQDKAGRERKKNIRFPMKEEEKDHTVSK